MSVDFTRRTSALLGEDRILYALIVAYVLCTSIVLAILSRDVWRSLSLYFGSWLLMAFDALLTYIAVRLFWDIVRSRRICAPISLAERMGRIVTPQLVANSLLYVAITIYFGAFTGLKCTFPLIRPFYFDAFLSQWGRTIHRGMLWPFLHALFDGRWRNEFVFFSYYVAWPVILMFSPLAAAFLKDRVLRQRYLLCFVLSWILLGTIAALIFMSAGPIFYGRVTGDTHRYLTMQSYLQSHGMTWGAQHLWDVYRRSAIEPGAGISDFPSMHVAISTLATCFAWSLHRWLGVAMTVFTALIVLSSAYLGWHFMVGDYVVVPTVVGLWWSTAPGRFSVLARFLQGYRAGVRPWPWPYAGGMAQWSNAEQGSTRQTIHRQDQ